MPMYPDVYVQLTGEDGNIFSIMARTVRSMRFSGLSEEAVSKYRDAVMACGSYDEALRVTMNTVSVQ